MGDKKIGVVGLGAMGGAIAHRLAENRDVIGYDTSEAARTRSGLATAQDLAELVREVEIVCLSLPLPQISVDVVREIAGIADRRTRLVIEMSTTGLEPVEESAAILEKAGLAYLDCPVSGGRGRALTGELCLIVAGSDEAVALAEPVLSQAGRPVRVGPRPGMGQAAKLANNVISAATLAMTSEAVGLAVATGVPLEKVIEVVNLSSGQSDTSKSKFPQFILSGSYDFGGLGKTTLKDVELYVKWAHANGRPELLGERTVQIWRAFVAANPDADMTRMYPYLSSIAAGEA